MIGFALVFVLVAGALSAFASGAVAIAGAALRRRGPYAERQAAELAATGPLVIAAVIVGALLARAYAGVDHCGVHDHHAHLCLTHGGDWVRIPWVVAVTAVAGFVGLARLALIVRRHAIARRAVRGLAAAASVRDGVAFVDAAQPFCFVAGVRRPRIYVSTAAWRGLAEDERAAMLAHEQGHVAHGDLRRRLLLELALVVAAPLAAAMLLRRWAAATERIRDRDAARAVGDAEPVARAMVRMCRLARGAAVPGVAFTPRGGDLSQRVEALLTGGPSGRRAAGAIFGVLTATTLTVTALAAANVEVLHHALETLLG